MQTSIQPVSYGPLGTGNLLTLRGVGPVNDTGRPNYFYEVADKQLVTPAVPAVPASGNTPEVPAVPAVYSTTSITSGNIAMTPAQWDNWGKNPTDEAYQLACICTNLGLTLA